MATTVPTWSHAPSTLTLLWMLISLPLVIWDTGYVLGRPHTMPGGAWHAPLYTPYKLYGEIDHVYGLKAFESRLGFTSAQGTLNVAETLMYLVYMYLYFARGKFVGGTPHSKRPQGNAASTVKAQRRIDGRDGAVAVLVGFSAAIMTFSKTALYAANEYFSGFDGIGHNSLFRLVFLWIVPNGSWLVFSAYMVYALGGDIVDGLTMASKPKAKNA